MLKTRGISPKLVTAVTAPLSAAVYAFVSTGSLDRPSLGLAAVALIAGLGTYIAGPGDVGTP